MQDIESKLTAILQSGAVRSDTIANRILDELQSCHTSSDVIAVLDRLTKRIEEIHTEAPTRTMAQKTWGRDRINIRL